MYSKNSIENRLHSINRQRNRLGYIPNILLATFSTYFQRDLLLQNDLWWISLLVIGVGLALRVMTTELIYDEWKRGNFGARVLNLVGIFVVVIGWMLHFNAIYTSYGGGSIQTASSLIIIAGLVTGSTVSLAAHRPSFFLYATSMCGIPCFIYFMDPQIDKSIIGYVVVFYFFNVSNLLAAHKQLRRSIENELRSESETERIRGIIDTVPGFVGILNSNLEFTLANRATIQLFPKIIGQRYDKLQPNAKWTADFRDFMQSDRSTMTSEQHTELDSVGELHLIMSTQKMDDGGAIIVSVQINDLVEARQKLREQEAKAQFSAKLASLGEMAAGIAHEVNNPLTIIQGGAGIIQKLVQVEPIDRVAVLDLANKLITTSERISKIIKSLKNLSRTGEKDPMANVDLQTLINQTLDICRQRATNHSIELRLPNIDPPVSFRGREVQLGQVLLNLISNSIDAVKERDERWIELKYKVQNESLELCVIDSGPGIPKEIVNKVMEPFFTTKEINQGTGLGLSISRNIMREHGGELLIDTQAPNTTFRMHLPLSGLTGSERT